jgi:hypothetical protein
VPTRTANGSYSVSAMVFGTVVFVNESVCEAGWWCQDGARYPCPAGRFGNSSGVVTALCSGPCQRGYFCGDGSVSPTADVCGGAEVYCVEVGDAASVAVDGREISD